MKKYLFILLIFVSLSFSQILVKTIDLPNNNHFNYGYGMVARGGLLWIATSYTASNIGYKFYAVDTNGVLKDSVIINKTHINDNAGLGWDGTNFWYMKRYISISRLFKISANGTVLDSLSYPPSGWYPGGICYDRNGIWVSVYYPNDKAALYKTDISNPLSIDTIPVFGKQPQGIAVKGDTLFYVMDGFDGDPERIYAIKLGTKDTLFSFKVPETVGQRQNPRGLAWDGKYLYLLAEPVGASSGRKVFQYDISKSGGSPSINLITKTIAFQNWYIDSTSLSSISVQNQGDAVLRIDSAVISNSSFSLTPGTFPVNIPPNQVFNFVAKFKPSRFGVYNDSVIFYHNDNSTNFKITKFSGKGIYYNQFIACEDNIFNYGQKKNRSTSLKDFVIENRGSKKLIIYGIQLNHPFYRDALTYKSGFPDTITIDSVSSYKLRIWYKPDSYGSSSDSIRFSTNSLPFNTFYIKVAGESAQRNDTLGSIRWQTTIPANPSTSSQDYSVASMKPVPDVTGDGKADLVVATENYQLLMYNGNSSGNADLIWRFNHGYNNNNSGNVVRVQALQSFIDINYDGADDILLGLGGGNEFVYCISGKTGLKIWEYGDSVNYQNGDINGIDCKRDFNNDGIPDVLLTASGDMNGYGRYSVYCLNGLNGNILWQISEANPPKHTSGIISTTSGGAFSSYSISGSAPYYVKGFNKAGQVVWTANTLAAVWALIEISNIGGSSASDVIAADFLGNVYAYSGDNGNLLWQKYVSGPFYTDLRLIPDINGNGTPEIFGAGPDPSLILLEGKTGETMWTNTLGTILLGVSETPDMNNDGSGECIAGALGNNMRVVNGKTGATMFEYYFGSGSNGTAAEKFAYINDVDSDGYPEFTGSSRDGRLICFSGGAGSSSTDSLKVISPNGGEKWVINSSREIKWSSTPGIQNIKIDYSTDNGVNWAVVIQSVPAASGTFQWTVPNSPSNQCLIKISSVISSSIFDISDNVFSITTQLCKDVNIAAGWNIISVPLISADMSKTSLFPAATSVAYGYDNTYLAFDTLKMGMGYWLKFPGQQTVTICGNPFNQNSVPVKTGWNLIGPFHNNISTGLITSTPPGIIASGFYEYNNGYNIANTLIAGKGYWVRTTDNGIIEFPAGNLTKAIDNLNENVNTILSGNYVDISDASGKSSRLYFSSEYTSADDYQLPPVPPYGAFDVRFSDNKYMDNISGSGKTMIISSVNYPVTIKATGTGICLKETLKGNGFSKIIPAGSSINIDNEKIKILNIAAIYLPTEYSLSQNYPNPFNPLTKIKFALPEKGIVKLDIYNTLGQKVTQLINEEREAGYYEADWNASKYSSGIYYYELTVGNGFEPFREIKKMLLLK